MHRLVRPQMHSRHRGGGASTLLFSFASLELRLSKPAKPAVPTESGYPQGHRMHKTEHSAGADRHIERGSSWFCPQQLCSYTHIIHKNINRGMWRRKEYSVTVLCLLRYNEIVIFRMCWVRNFERCLERCCWPEEARRLVLIWEERAELCTCLRHAGYNLSIGYYSLIPVSLMI